MRFFKIVFVALLIIGNATFNFSQYSTFNKVSMTMESKSAKNGYINIMNAEILYASNGTLITEYKKPVNTTIITNSKGDIKIYNREENSVYIESNYLYSSDHSQLYYFLSSQSYDLGLSEMKFMQSDVRFEEGLMITDWLPPAQLAENISKVELVSENGRPIFMAYYDNNNQINSKTYFNDYITLGNRTPLPQKITQIVFNTPTDSIITRTNYSNIKLDNNANQRLVNFQIPNNAKTITK